MALVAIQNPKTHPPNQKSKTDIDH